MTQTTARIKQSGKPFEIIVDLDNALRFKKGESADFLETDSIFSDSKKGHVAPSKDLQESFGTTNVNTIAEKIIKNGEILVTQEHRDSEKENKFKQVVDFLASNAVDPQTGSPHTPERIKNALDQANVNIKNTPLDTQIKDIVTSISSIIPIKLETKRIRISVPAVHTGKAYGILNQYKEEEKWLNNGDLEVLVEVPSGMVMDFYDKLNSVTHGSALTEEVKEE
jgi:ribosome maturation protein SDO1